MARIDRLDGEGRYGEATTLAERAALLAEKTLGAHHLDVAMSLNNLAVLYYKQSRYGEAEPLYVRALDIAEKMLGTHHPDLVTILNNLAELYWTQGRYGEAEPLYRRALGIREKALGAHHPDLAQSLNNLAGLYRAQSRYGEAEPLYRRALGIREKALGAYHPDLAQSLNNLALLYNAQGQYGEAEPLYMRALSIREKALGAHHPDVAASLNNLAALYDDQGRHGEAEPLYRRALGIFEKRLGAHHPGLATSLNNLAELYWTQGRYGEAEPLYQRALGIFEETLGAHHPDLATSLNNLAGLYQTQGRYGEAEPLYRRALGIAERALGTHHLAVAMSLNNLADLYRTQGRYGEAEPLHRRALGIVEKALGTHHPDVALSLNNLGMLYHAQGRYDEAEPLYRRALGIFEKTLGAHHPDLATSLNNLAGLYQTQGRYGEAEPLYRRALGIAEKALGSHHLNVAASLNNLAILYDEQGRYGEAEPLHVRTLGIREKALGAHHPDVAVSLNNLAVLYQTQGRYGEAEPLHVRALSILAKTLGAHHPNVTLSLNNLAALYLAQKDLGQAIRYAERAERASDDLLSTMMRHGSEQQKHAFMAKDLSEVDIVVTLALHAPDNPRAQDLVMRHLLRRKGRVLDAMRSTLVAIRDNLDDEGQALLDRYLSLRSQYATQYLRGPQHIEPEQHQKNLAELEKQKREIEVQLSEKSSQFAEVNRTVTLDDVQSVLPDDAVLIEWLRYRPFDASARGKDRWQRPRYAACVLARRRMPTCLDLGDAETIDAAAVAFHRAVALGLESRGLAHKLDALIMAPVRRALGSVRKLYLSPDGALQFIPFAALLHQEDSGPERYLVEQFELVHVTSGRDLVRKPRARFQPGPVTVLGDPRYNVPGTPSIDRFQPLHGTYQEAKTIGRLFDGARIITDADASESVVKNVHAPSILHLATHAYFGARDCAGKPQATDNPLLAAGLALAGANACHDDRGGDGVLTGEELAGLDLYGTQLVVLSACDTGIGALALREENRLLGIRDGVYGLRRALILAGAETQVVSLWKVKDLATQELMGAYYRALLEGRGRAEALRQVQLHMLRTQERAHPYYWASFVVVGMDAPLRLPPGQPRPGTTPRGPRGCACDAGANSPAPDWTTIMFALAVLVGLRLRCRSGGAQEESVCAGNEGSSLGAGREDRFDMTRWIAATSTRVCGTQRGGGLARTLLILALSVPLWRAHEAHAQEEGRAPAENSAGAAVAEWQGLSAETKRLYEEGRYAEAIPFAEREVLLAENAQGGHHRDVAISLQNLAQVYMAQGRFKDAEPLLERALSIVELPGARLSDLATVLDSIAGLYRLQGQYKKAELRYLRALDIRQKEPGPHRVDLAQSLNNLATLYWEQGRYREAKPLHERVLSIAKEALGAHHPHVATSLLNLAGVHAIEGRYDEAEALFQRALDIRVTALGANHPHVAASLDVLARLYYAQARYGEAESLYQRALSIRERALRLNHPSVATSLNNLAEVYQAKGQYREAERLYMHALSIRETELSLNHPDVATSLNNLADLYQAEGRYGEAKLLLQRALGIFEQTRGQDHPDVALSLDSLADLFQTLGRYTDAAPLRQRALRIWENALGPNHLGVAASLNNLATLYWEQGQYLEAKRLCVRALGIFEQTLESHHPTIAASLNNLATLNREQGRNQEAEQQYMRALSIVKEALGAHHPVTVTYLVNLATLYLEQKDFDRAIDYMEQAEQASDEFLSAMMRHGSEQQKHAFMAIDIREVDFGVTLALRAPRVPQAQRLAIRHLLRRKGRVLDAMRSTIVAIRDNLDDDGRVLLDQYVSIRSQYATQYLRGPQNIALEQHQKNLANLEQQKHEIEVRLSEKSSQFVELNRAVTLEDIQTALPVDAALIEWVHFKPFEPGARERKDRWQPARYAVCVLLRRGPPRCMDLGDAETIDAAALAFHRAVALGLESRALARKLDALIMAPVRRTLGSARKLYLSPDGVLQFIPFAALLDQDDSGPERYLVEQFELVHVTSGRDLVRKPRAGFLAGPVTVLGNPSYGMSGTSSMVRFEPRLGTYDEAKEIGRLFAGARVLTDTNASESALKKARAPSILHLATHAYFGAQDCVGQPQATDNPLLAAGLALAGANACHDDSGGDGVLTGEELAGLDLYGTQLVVLSACDTGIGKLALNDQNRLVGVRDGVYGLRRALMLAGAETLVVSLWKVDDLVTQELMGAYYRALLGGRGKAEALRLVQLDMLRSGKRTHPKHWASFVVVGMDAPLRLPPGQIRPETTPRGPRGCACDVGTDSSAPGWATLGLMLVAAVGLRRPRSGLS